MVKNTDSSGEKNVYEVGYLLLPSIPEDKTGKVVDSIKSAISNNGGEVIESEDPFKHPLAYQISKTVGASRYVVNEAYIGWIKFEAESSDTPEIKTLIEKIDEVLRFILIKAPRETTFTFAKAKEAIARKLEEEEAAKEAESADSGLEEEVVVQ